MKSVMTHTFSRVPSAEIPRSQFNRSHGHKTTFDAGVLVPIYVDEALPGDTFSLRLTSFARLATPIVPFMDNIFLDSFFFAVPIRLIWDNWQKFNGEQTDPDDSTDYLCPIVDLGVGSAAVGSFEDYIGVPTGVPGIEFSAFPGRAYKLIWNEWFRDQNLQDSVAISKGDGPDTATSGLLRRGKRHDYFTSCLPWPQKGPAVELPLGSTAPVYGQEMTDTIGMKWQGWNSTGSTRMSGSVSVTGSGTAASRTLFAPGGLGTSNTVVGVSLGTESDYAVDGKAPYADLSAATAATINQLRQAFQIQKLYERDARGGTRYTEIIKAHFGVTSPDARLQRPEYLGGGTTAVNIHPVSQTSSTDATTPQGNLAAFGTASKSGDGFTKSFTEHCIIMGFVCARADLNYQQGLERMFSRRTRWDYYWPALSHLGEQAVLNKEIYCQGTSADEDVFGYQERYAEYRYKPSRISGLFRSQAASSIDIWHLAQEFTALPVLNDEFIIENPPIDRVIATPTEPHFLYDSFIDVKCARPMPTYSVPGLIDHF